ncbi:hypothetical protein PTKU46_62760 [Paraburkholderia terrae]
MLLARRRADLAHQIGHLAHRLHDFAHRAARLVDERGAAVHAAHRFADQVLDLLRRRSAALRERADLARDDREAASLFARARRFDGRVQREDIGLERDPFGSSTAALRRRAT